MARKKITISRQSAGHVLLQILDIFLPGADRPRGEVSSVTDLRAIAEVSPRLFMIHAILVLPQLLKT